MHIDVLSVCRRPPAWVTSARDEYAKRLRGAITLEFRNIAPGRDTLTASARRDDEGRRLRKLIRSDAHLVALDVGGDAPDSEAFARQLDGWRARCRYLALVIGGADGLAGALIEAAHTRWSLSPLTLPHLLVQVVVAEQVYRAWTILEGHPYHRG